MESLKYRSGFSLIELVIVVAVIAALFGMTVPYFQNNLAESRTSFNESMRSFDRDIVPIEPDPEQYRTKHDDGFLLARERPLSTLSIDVDTASLSNVRRFVNQHVKPPPEAVRVEELINYFPYACSPPVDGKPIAVAAEVASCPWNPSHRLTRITIKGRERTDKRIPCNLVFLIDVSGSMDDRKKLPLVKASLALVVDQLQDEDSIGVVVYAGSSRIALPPTPGGNRKRILSAVEALEAGGSTNGGAGIRDAYAMARTNFIKGGVNRVILATDGDFNVGATTKQELLDLIGCMAKSGIYLSVLGVGMSDLKDDTLELLADNGNGNYAYIDSLREARKVLLEQARGTLVTVAKDVKVQVEFNPAYVSEYRLVGYENRKLTKVEFEDEGKDAGDLGAGQSVTVLYELATVGTDKPSSGSIRTTRMTDTATAYTGRRALTVTCRYKEPERGLAGVLAVPVNDVPNSLESPSLDFTFASAVAEFGMILKGSPFVGNATLAGVDELARSAKGTDANHYRSDFIELVQDTRRLMERP